MVTKEITFLIHGEEDKVKQFTHDISKQVLFSDMIDYDVESGVKISRALSEAEIQERRKRW